MRKLCVYVLNERYMHFIPEPAFHFSRFTDEDMLRWSWIGNLVPVVSISEVDELTNLEAGYDATIVEARTSTLLPSWEHELAGFDHDAAAHS